MNTTAFPHSQLSTYIGNIEIDIIQRISTVNAAARDVVAEIFGEMRVASQPDCKSDAAETSAERDAAEFLQRCHSAETDLQNRLESSHFRGEVPRES